MNINDLNELPDWKDSPDEDGESWKPNPTRDACKALYLKWNEIMGMLSGAVGTMKDAPEGEDDAMILKDTKSMMLGDAYEIGAKIRSSEAGRLMYILRMEHAAIIRRNAEFVKSCVLSLVIQGDMDEEHGEIIRAEMDEFKALFKIWVGTFKKDEYEDDWGLFV